MVKRPSRACAIPVLFMFALRAFAQGDIILRAGQLDWVGLPWVQADSTVRLWGVPAD